MILCLDSPSHYKKWELYSEAVEYYGAYKLLFGLVDMNRITCAIFTVESSFLNHLVCNFLKKKSIRVIYFVDGVFEWNNSYSNSKINCRPVLETTHYDFAYVMSNGLTRRYLNVAGNVKNFYNKKVVGGDVKLCCARPVGARILITTAKTPYFNHGELKRLSVLIEKLTATLDDLGLDYAWRVFDSKLLDIIDLRGRPNITSASFSEAVSSFSSVITTPSSVSLEAMAMDVRVGHFLYRDCPNTIPAAWNFHLSMDMRAGVKNIAQSDLGRRDRFQRSIVDEFCADAVPPSAILKELEQREVKVRFRFFERFDFLWRFLYESIFK